MSSCLALDCDRPRAAQGWCMMHYQRWRIGSRGVSLNRGHQGHQLVRCARCGDPSAGRGATRCNPCIDEVRTEVDRIATQWFGLALMQMWVEALGSERVGI